MIRDHTCRAFACAALRVWLLGVACWGASGAWVQAADLTSVDVGAPAEAGAARFALDVDAPAALKALLLKHLDVQRFRQLPDLDAPELSRLLQATPQHARDLLATQGYFQPQVSVTHRPAQAQGDGPPLGRVAIRIAPGPQTRVASAGVYFLGDAAKAPEAQAQREAIERTVQQDLGQVMTQSRWDQAKAQALRGLTVQRYPMARLSNSLSDVEAEPGLAHWHIELDSGDAVRIGAVQVKGAERYDPAMVEHAVRLAGLGSGVDYSLTALQTAQQRIAASPYYTSVFAYADLDAQARDGRGLAPIVVQVQEALPQKLVLGVGGSTNSGARVSAEYSHLWVPGIEWRVHNALKLDGHDQSFASDWQSPLNARGWQQLASLRWSRQVDGTTTTRGLRLSAGQSQEADALDRRYYVQLDRSRTHDTASLLASSQGNETALSANLGWTWRRFNQVPYPDQGDGLGVNLGAGLTLNPSRHPFLTAHARWLTYWPLGASAPADASESDGPRTAGRLALRLEGGAVLASQAAPLPDTLLYRAGGDNSVRGYGLRDIGVVQADGSVTAGRYLSVASLEWQQAITIKGVRTAWERVLFVDAGAVSDGLTHTRPQIGAGVGARYNSPVGPVQMDLAYGVNIKRYRLHFNVGFGF